MGSCFILWVNLLQSVQVALAIAQEPSVQELQRRNTETHASPHFSWWRLFFPRNLSGCVTLFQVGTHDLHSFASFLVRRLGATAQSLMCSASALFPCAYETLFSPLSLLFRWGVGMLLEGGLNSSRPQR